jgi:protein phosphatase
MRIEACAVNHKGLVRLNNEDNFYLSGSFIAKELVDQPSCLTKLLTDQSPVIAAVCDGVGGAQAGEVAAYTVVSALGALMSGFNQVHDTEQITIAMRRVSQRIASLRQNDTESMGATIVMACIQGERLLITNVGDSRAYLMRLDTLYQLSEDHSEVWRLYNMGIITREEMNTHPRRHVITQYLGLPETELLIDPAYSEIIQLQPGDRILLCSDGVTDMLSDEEITQILQAVPQCETAAQTLVTSALQNGGKDNTTALLLQVLQENE